MNDKVIKKIVVICVLSVWGMPSRGEASGAVKRRQMAQQQAIESKKAAIMRKQQEEQIAYERAMRKKAYENAVRQRELEYAAYMNVKAQMEEKRRMYEHVLKQKIKAKHEAQKEAYEQARKIYLEKKKVYEDALAQQELAKKRMEEQIKAGDITQGTSQSQGSSMEYQPADIEQVEEISTLSDIWKELEITSEVWPLIIDQKPKEMIVKKYVEWYGQQNIHIQKPAAHYVQMIDGMVQDNPDALKKPFKEILQIMAIIEYDFDNGTDKDWLAMQVLGSEGYWNNRERLGK
jgi:flagellar biosynthesis GTPase FlhF